MSNIFPGADQSRRYDHLYPGVDQGRITKLVLHSTETAKEWGPPGYNGGAYAPTLTICPWTKRRWQHFPVDISARALLNPSWTGVSENRDKVSQIEIIGYSDADLGREWGSNLRDLDDEGYDFIAETVKWFLDEQDVPNSRPSLWPEYPASYGDTSARMSSGEYDRFTGWLAHLHVSGNTHGDVTIDPERLAEHIDRAVVITDSGSSSSSSSSSGSRAATWDVNGLDVATIKALQREVGVAVDGIIGPDTAVAVQEWLGVAEDGWWGYNTVTALQERVGVTVDGIWGPRTSAALADYLDAGHSGSDLVVDGIMGPATVRALQEWVGVAVDGIMGPNTKRALQRKLGVAVDGIIGPDTNRALQREVGAPVDGIWGSNTTRHLQRFLNRVL